MNPSTCHDCGAPAVAREMSKHYCRPCFAKHGDQYEVFARLAFIKAQEVQN